MSLLNLFKLSYFFDADLGFTFPGEWLSLGILTGLVVASFYLPRRFKLLFKDRLLGFPLRLLHNSSLWLGLGGLTWLFFRYQGVRIINLRVWPALLVLYFLVSLVYGFYFVLKRLPALKEAQEKRGTKERFLRMARRRQR